VIAGAGAIGVEFAYVMANYGVQVTLVEFLDRLVPLEEPDVSKELARAYKKLGVTVLAGTKVEAIDDSGDKVKVTVSPAKGGDSRVIETDKVLQAIGFAPRTEGYGLENTGVKLSDRGAVEIDDYMRTNVPHIYAIGDCTGKLLLAHTAEA
jgi:dihydrolipoamide dehydrogenase